MYTYPGGTGRHIQGGVPTRVYWEAYTGRCTNLSAQRLPASLGERRKTLRRGSQPSLGEREDSLCAEAPASLGRRVLPGRPLFATFINF